MRSASIKVVVSLAILGAGAVTYYEHRIANVLRGAYDNSKQCDGDWWTHRAEARNINWAEIRVAGSTDSSTLRTPIFRMRACMQIAGARLQEEARKEFDNAMAEAQGAARRSLYSSLSYYLDERYSIANSLADGAKDFFRTVGAFVKGWSSNDFGTGAKQAWGEMGRTQRESEEQRLLALYTPAANDFNILARQYFSEEGPYKQRLDRYADGLISRIVGIGVRYAGEASLRSSGPKLRSRSVSPTGTSGLGTIPQVAIGIGSDALVDAALADAAASAGLAGGVGRMGAAAVVASIAIVKIDEHFNRSKVERERRDDLDAWLARAAVDAGAAHASALGKFDAAIRASLEAAAARGGLSVERVR